MAIGILGGTFDPVHHAHLAMARAALDALKLDKVVFIPTGTTRYRNAAVASPRDRVAMLQLALQGKPKFALDERELQPGASGYTADTLQGFKDKDVYLLMGADQYEKLDTWHRPDEVRRLAKIAVFARPGIELQDKVKLIPMTPLPISASDIRARVGRGEKLDGLVPPAVANYIARHKLYS